MAHVACERFPIVCTHASSATPTRGRREPRSTSYHRVRAAHVGRPSAVAAYRAHPGAQGTTPTGRRGEANRWCRTSPRALPLALRPRSPPTSRMFRLDAMDQPGRQHLVDDSDSRTALVLIEFQGAADDFAARAKAASPAATVHRPVLARTTCTHRSATCGAGREQPSRAVSTTWRSPGRCQARRASAATSQPELGLRRTDGGTQVPQYVV